MLKLKPFIYSPSVRPHRGLAGSLVADKSSSSVPVKSLKQSPHQSIHYFPPPILPTRRRLIHRSFSVSMESSGVSTTSPSVVKLKPIEATAETFKEFGQVIEASPDGEEFGPRDAQLDLSNGIPRFYIMQLKDRSLKFSKITHHANVTQCLGSIGGNVWYLGVAKPSIVDPTDIKGAVDIVVQSHCGHFYVPPAVDEVQAFRISGPKFIKLSHGTWHAGPLFTDDKMDFYNLELNNTNVVDHTTHDFIKKNGVDVYLEYEKKTYAKLINSIEAQPSKALQAILKSTLAKIYKRQKSKFMGVYEQLKGNILKDLDINLTNGTCDWVAKMLDHNLLGGKLNRGLSAIDSYSLLKEGKQLTSEEIIQISSLGWCIEWLQGYFLVHDDIMDGSSKRRGQPCWFRLSEVGMIAVNDGILLRNHIAVILKQHFRGKPYYVDLLELFNEVEYQTASGQMIDLITTQGRDLSKYSLPIHRRIVQYKTAYYSFYLPVACALLMAGENLDNHANAKDILIKMGIYFQVQDDYLDCFADPQVLGKNGTDITDFKCSWLVVKALEHCNEEQRKLLDENYGQDDEACVAKIKALYKDLKLEDVYQEYENNTYEELKNSIEDHETKLSKAMQAVLKSFLAKIYKRKK